MEIQLKLVNQSKSESVDVVIFQKNVATKLATLAVAWRVISNSRPADTHSFAFPFALELGASDGLGDLTPRVAASAGQSFHLAAGSSGNELSYAGSAASKANIQFRNDLSREAVNVNIYRAGLPLATKTGVAPQQKAVFQFKPTIYIGVVSQIVEGQIMDSAIISQVNTELSLLGITAANIIMTGGGPGPSSTPFKFSLANVMHAV